MDNFLANLQPLPFPEQMRQWDKNAAAFGVPEEMLMENAARVCAELIWQLKLAQKGKTVWVFMGNGNNGGDAAALARHLADAGCSPKVFTIMPFEAIKGAAGLHARLARQDGVEFCQLVTPDPDQPLAAALLRQICGNTLDRPCLIVDGVLGTGFSGALRSGVEMLLNAVNELASFLKIPVFSIDAPSGLNCVTGRPQPTAIRADYTLTLAAAKPGLVLPEAKKWTGELYCREIGMPKKIERPATYHLLDGACLTAQAPLASDSCKNTFGHVFVLGGCASMKGAPVLACLGALRAGAGLVTICAPADVCCQASLEHPEIMTLPVSEGAKWPDILPGFIMAHLQKADALVVGPGMGRDDDSRAFLKALLAMPSRPATVFDADALYQLSREPSLLALTGEKDAFTPHPGEAGFLLGSTGKEVQKNRFKALESLLELVVGVVVLKGAATVLGQTNQTRLLCPYDVPQMAIAGSGDVLSGCLAAFMAREKGPVLPACARAVITHVMAGLLCAREAPRRGALAGDLANALAEVPVFLKELSQVDNREGKLPWPA